MTTDHAQLDAAIAALGLTYAAEFIPQSKSRNKGNKHPSINWRVTLARPGMPDRYALTVDYSQGIGHVPGLDARRRISGRTIDIQERERDASERGEYWPGRFRSDIVSGRKLPAPELRDVLYCLVQDSSVIEHGRFEDWAQEYGYDADSREAERTYRQCLEQSLTLRALIGGPALEKLRELFTDY